MLCRTKPPPPPPPSLRKFLVVDALLLILSVWILSIGAYESTWSGMRRSGSSSQRLLADPRRNASMYDIVVRRERRHINLSTPSDTTASNNNNKNNTNNMTRIGSVRDTLLRRGLIRSNMATLIHKYKLIYASPQLMPPSTSWLQNASIREQQQQRREAPLFSVDERDGAIYMAREATALDFLCRRRRYCSCLSCIFSLNVIYFTNNDAASATATANNNNKSTGNQRGNKIGAHTIRVFVDDANDHAPEFRSELSSTIRVNVSERAPVGHIIRLHSAYTVAHDPDVYYNQLSYYVSDHESDHTGGGGGGEMGNGNDDDGDEDNENADGGSFDGSVGSRMLFMRRTSRYFDLLVVESSGMDAADESDTSTGQRSGVTLSLVVKTRLDYERRRSYELDLIVADNGGRPAAVRRRTATRRLIVDVLDENDNAPVCDTSVFVARVHENAVVRRLVQVKASDADTALNARLSYSLVTAATTNDTSTHSSMSLANLFHVDTYTGWLSVVGPLDYETRAFYELKVKATDLSPSPDDDVDDDSKAIEPSDAAVRLSTYCRVRMNVVDVNDNPASLRVVKYLNESSQEQQQQPNQFVELDESVASTTSSAIINVYERSEPLDADDGEQLLLAVLGISDKDSPSDSLYNCTLEQLWPPPPPPPPPPTVTSQMWSSFGVRRRIMLGEHDQFELFATNASSLDAERVPSYTLRLTLVGDENEQEKEATNRTIVLVVNVLDANDHAPVFARRVYTYSIRENELAFISSPSSRDSSPFIDVIDLDASVDNSRLTFSLSSNQGGQESSSIFNCSSNNWLAKHVRTYQQRTVLNVTLLPSIQVVEPFDYEETTGGCVELTLTARDPRGRADSVCVIIKVEDVNEHAPQFDRLDVDTFAIGENLPAGTRVAQVRATDKDASAHNSQVSYKLALLVPTDTAQTNAFTVDKSSGTITNSMPLDREQHSSYSIQIQACDSGEPTPLCSSVTHTIRVLDTNDNSPRFIYPNKHTGRILVHVPTRLAERNENDGYCHALFDVIATDPDTDQNARLVYELLTRDPDASVTQLALRIDAANGSVCLDTSTLNTSSSSSVFFFNASIVVSDTGSPPLSASLNVSLEVNYGLLPPQTPLAATGHANDDAQDDDDDDDDELLSKYQPRHVDSNNNNNNNKAASMVWQTVCKYFLIGFLIVMLVLMIALTTYSLKTVYKNYWRGSFKLVIANAGSSSLVGPTLLNPATKSSSPSASTSSRFSSSSSGKEEDKSPSKSVSSNDTTTSIADKTETINTAGGRSKYLTSSSACSRLTCSSLLSASSVLLISQSQPAAHQPPAASSPRAPPLKCLDKMRYGYTKTSKTLHSFAHKHAQANVSSTTSANEIKVNNDDNNNINYSTTKMSNPLAMHEAIEANEIHSHFSFKKSSSFRDNHHIAPQQTSTTLEGTAVAVATTILDRDEVDEGKRELTRGRETASSVDIDDIIYSNMNVKRKASGSNAFARISVNSSSQGAYNSNSRNKMVCREQSSRLSNETQSVHLVPCLSTSSSTTSSFLTRINDQIAQRAVAAAGINQHGWPLPPPTVRNNDYSANSSGNSKCSSNSFSASLQVHDQSVSSTGSAEFKTVWSSITST